MCDFNFCKYLSDIYCFPNSKNLDNYELFLKVYVKYAMCVLIKSNGKNIINKNKLKLKSFHAL
jgi:hypothetical protein